MKKKVFIITITVIILIIPIIIAIIWFQTIHTKGVVKYLEKRVIFFDSPVIIKKIHVKKGDFIKNDQPLITFNLSKIYESKAQKEYELKKTINAHKNQINSVTILRNEIELAKSTLDLSTIKLSGMENLFNIGAASLIEIKELREIVNLNKKKLRELELKLENEIGPTAEIEVIEKLISNLILEIKNINEMLVYNNIRDNVMYSPFENSVIEDIYFNEGSLVEVDSNFKIISIINLDSLIINAQIPEDQIKKINIGAKVKITPLADKSFNYFGDYIIFGFVDSVSKMAYLSDFTSYFLIEIKFKNNKDVFLLPNCNADIQIYNEKYNPEIIK